MQATHKLTEQTSLRLPKALDCNQEIALQQAINYYDAVVNMDISRVDNVERNPERTKKILQSYARFIGSQRFPLSKKMSAQVKQTPFLTPQ
mgnify:CR=1 FL=1